MCQLIGAGTISCGAPGSRPGSERNLLLSEEYSLCCEIRLVSGRPEPTSMWVSVEQDLLVRRPAGVQGVLGVMKPNTATGTPSSELYINVKTPYVDVQ